CRSLHQEMPASTLACIASFFASHAIQPQPTCAAQQPSGNRNVQDIPQNAIDERGLIRAGQIENCVGYPSAERHVEQRGGNHGTYACAGLLGRKVLTNDDGVGGYDAALKQTEQRRDKVQGGEPIERKEQEQRDALEAG